MRNTKIVLIPKKVNRSFPKPSTEDDNLIPSFPFEERNEIFDQTSLLQ